MKAAGVLGFLALLPVLFLQACVDVVIDQAHLKGELPLTVPAMLPDSASPKALQIQTAIRLSPSTHYQEANRRWDDFPVGGSIQLQKTLNSRYRLASGVSVSEGASAWVGPVIFLQTGTAVWESEILFGASLHSISMKGHILYDIEEPRDTSTFSSSGSHASIWGQFALRVRSAGSGPWLEGRVLPFTWGELSTADVAYPAYASSTVISLGSGWKWDLAGGRMAALGARAVWVDKQREVQLIAQWQRPLL